MKRRWQERIAWVFMAGATFGGVALLLLILVIVLWQGGPALSIEFLTTASSGFGETGGILFQIVGTCLLMAGAVAVCLPVVLGSVLFQTEFVRSLIFKKIFRLFIYSLNGVPTLLFGLIGYIVFGLLLETGVSWLTGVLILAVMILPTLHVSLQESVEAIPVHYREAGQALGLTPWQMIVSVILPQSFFGLVTGALLGLARAGGETAAIMFTATAFSGAGWPESWSEPVATLQTHILVLAQEAINPQAITNAWGSAAVLMGIVMLLIGSALFLRMRFPMEAER